MLQVTAIYLPDATNLRNLVCFYPSFPHSFVVYACVCWPGDAGGPGADHQGSGNEAFVFRPTEE